MLNNTPLSGCTSKFIHQLTERHLDCFQVLPIITTGFVRTWSSHSVGYYQGAQSLDHMVRIRLDLQGGSRHLAFPPAGMRPPTVHFFICFQRCHVLGFGHFYRYVVVPCYCFSFQFPNDTFECLCRYLFATCIHSLVRCLSRPFAQFLNWLFTLLLHFNSFILDNSLYQIYLLQMFSPSFLTSHSLRSIFHRL